MYLPVSINVNSIKEASNLLFICEISCKKLLNILKCNVPIVFMIDFVKYFSESFSFLFIDFASVSYDVLDTLTEKERLAIIFHPFESGLGYLAA